MKIPIYTLGVLIFAGTNFREFREFRGFLTQIREN